ncbi:TnsA-like heteromeric transposase endonuclease subunit [Streptomyces niveus]|uniref:TnsA-like heteromeric transposase endonuclease subunit n=1 Tax=Streptomyces niveus TaxID=193462 RepID=UPI00342B00BE
MVGPFRGGRTGAGFPFLPRLRNFSGWYWAATGATDVGYESWVELGHLMRLDSEPAVVAMSSQPFRLSWRYGGRGKRVRHTPDYFVRRRDGTAVVIDVRPDELIEPDDAVKFGVTAVACAQVGWVFERVGVLPPVLAANLRWLSGYRHPRVRREPVVAALTTMFTEPRGLLAGARAVGDPIAVLPVLFHLLWRRELVVAVENELLSAATLVRPAAVFAREVGGDAGASDAAVAG